MEDTAYTDALFVPSELQPEGAEIGICNPLIVTGQRPYTRHCGSAVTRILLGLAGCLFLQFWLKSCIFAVDCEDTPAR
jgi:hypothetical protein